MDTAAESPSSQAHGLKGAIKRALGWLTADRRVEAEGSVEERIEAEPTEAQVEREEQAIKDAYGETVASRTDQP